MTPHTHVACLNLAPWPLTLLEKRHPGVPVAVLGEGNRQVVYANGLALDAGVQPGMRETAALSRCPDLHAEVVSGPTSSAAWNELLELLYARYSDRVEGRDGLAFLVISLGAAQGLAAALHASVGIAESREVAQLASLRAAPGQVMVVTGKQAGEQAEKLFLQLTPLSHLHVLGVTPEKIEGLRFLGITGLADLWKWSSGQREAFLGVDAAKRLNRFLKGERQKAVQRYQPGQVIEATFTPEAPLTEPCQSEAALHDLVPIVWNELRGRTAAYLTVHADTMGGRLSGTRKLKWPLDTTGIQHLADVILAETEALALGVDSLSVQLSGIRQPGRMVGLWAGVAELEVTSQVLDRYPDALVKVHWLDPYAYVADAMYEWVDWLTGEVRPTVMTPKRPHFIPRKESHQQAVNRVLAFFEGASP
ncbi:Y-family DNA polymerase [Deinococcus cavernae]|uniref:Y-family DNA polymerase n=1 Tax=Deinococcus cavernae TaxID=2320857 RepID=A0A418VHI2_9DEIO|nr:Y-family DNA polymerase [Deinococcus cavernae]RJF75562.1 Y-family DNA polymerase [Deinococcus cavernae]